VVAFNLLRTCWRQVHNKLAASWQLPRLRGNYGETGVMDFGLYAICVVIILMLVATMNLMNQYRCGVLYFSILKWRALVDSEAKCGAKMDTYEKKGHNPLTCSFVATEGI